MENQIYSDKQTLQLNDFVRGKYGKKMPNLPYFTKERENENIPTENGKQYLNEMNDFYLYSTGQLK